MFKNREKVTKDFFVKKKIMGILCKMNPVQNDENDDDHDTKNCL